MIDTNGRPPPQSMDDEGCVLSSILIDPSVLSVVLDIISPTDMYSNAHRRVLEAMVSLDEKGTNVDIMTVSTWLKENGRLAEVGGIPYLTQILNESPHVANVAEYAKAVKRFSSAREMIRTCQRTASRLYLLEDGIDVVLEDHEKAVADLTQSRGGKVDLKPISDAVKRTIRSHAEFSASGKKIRGHSTGFAKLDSGTGGFQDGDSTILGGRPGAGKTAACMSLAVNVAEQGFAVLVFSLEMPDTQLADRVICGEADKSLNTFRSKIEEKDVVELNDAVKFISKLPIYITDIDNLDIETIRATVRGKQIELHKIGIKVGLVIIDHLGLVRMPKADRHDLAVGHVTKTIKSAAKEFQVPFLTLCQLSRGVESRDDKRPLMSDLRDSGNIEQDADNIWFVYRDEYYNKKSDDKGIMELIVSKQRNGQTGTVKLAFDAKSTTVRELDYDPYKKKGLPY